MHKASAQGLAEPAHHKLLLPLPFFILHYRHHHLNAQGRLKAAQHELLLPSYTWRSAFCSTCLYYFACHFPATRFLGPSEGRAALTTLLVAHAALPEALGQALDWTKPLLGVVLALL